MKLVWMLSLALLVLPLAGCVGGDGANDALSNATAPASPAASAMEGIDPFAEAPVWSVGDHWTYATTGAGTYDLVVTEDLGNAWRIEATGEQVSFFDARTDVSTMGPQRKSDLAGSQNGTTVEFFRWPLTVGATWSTTWDGVEREITVVSIDGGVAELEAREGDVVRVSYSYDARAGWFGHFTFHNDDGSVSFGSTLQSSGEGFTGEVLRWTLEEVAQEAGTLGNQPTAWGGDFVLDEGEEVWLAFHVQCPSPAGLVSFGVGPTGDFEGGTGWTEVCPVHIAFEGVADTEPGEKSYGMIAGSPAEEGAYRVTILKRSVERVAVG